MKELRLLVQTMMVNNICGSKDSEKLLIRQTDTYTEQVNHETEVQREMACVQANQTNNSFSSAARKLTRK